jgi:hypothetical protein
MCPTFAGMRAVELEHAPAAHLTNKNKRAKILVTVVCGLSPFDVIF